MSATSDFWLDFGSELNPIVDLSVQIEAAFDGIALGELSLQSQHPEVACDLFKRALELFSCLAQADPESFAWPYHIAHSHTKLAETYEVMAQFGHAAQHTARAYDILGQLPKWVAKQALAEHEHRLRKRSTVRSAIAA